MKTKTFLLSAILVPAIGLAAPSSSLLASALNISGEYQCTGFDPYVHQPYSSLMSISKVTDRIYSISDQTVINHSPDFSQGDVFSDRETGILNNYVLAIAYQNRREPTEQGVEQVTFAPDGNSFFGLWTQMGGTMIGTESCQKLINSTLANS